MKRRVLTILLFLLLGVVVNVVVAWGFALGLDLGDGFRAGHESGDVWLGDNRRWVVDVYRHRGRVKIDSLVVSIQTSEWPRFPSGAPPESLLPAWSSITRPNPDEIARSEVIEMGIVAYRAVRKERALGWPWPSLRFHQELLAHPERGMDIYDVHGGILLRRSKSEIDPDTIALPLIPILPGTVGNILVYTLILGSLLLVWRMTPASFRRRRRIAAGRCPSCGYILGERFREGCPECGWRRGSQSAPTKRRWASVRAVLLYLSLALALTIAIAWVCAWSLDQERYWGRDDLEITSRDEAIAWWRDHAPAGFSRDPQQMHISRARFGVSIASGMVFRPGNTGWKPDEHMIRIHAGWPLRALEGCVWDRNPRITSYTGIIRVPGPSVREGWLPIRPLWRGMVINAVFYAVLLRIAMHWTLALRRAVWLRTHRCPACGRPMGDSPICEKCGLRFPERRRSG